MKNSATQISGTKTPLQAVPNRRYYHITASAGALGSLINEQIPLISSIVIGFVSIIKSVLPTFVQSENELSALDLLCDFYLSYMNSMENIWYKLDKGIIEEDEAMKEFFSLKATECDKQSLMNRGIRNISVKFQKMIDEQATKYINSVYYEQEQDE